MYMLKTASAMEENVWNSLIPDVAECRQVLTLSGNNPHNFLGIHRGPCGRGMVIRVFDPEARQIDVIVGEQNFEMASRYYDGLFMCWFPEQNEFFSYQLKRTYDHGVFTSEDPYHFLPCISEMDLYLFHSGEHQEIHKILGSHIRTVNGQKGAVFAVWAPNAARVSVVGSFNCWDGRRHQMRILGGSGVWEIFIPGVSAGDLYKYEIRSANGALILKTDPYAKQMEMRPGNASIVVEDDIFSWHDQEWIGKRENRGHISSPMNIYEVHLGSWGGPGVPAYDPEEKFDMPNYRELAVSLADYVKKMNYTHVELLPVTEYPLDESWGYQVSGYYAPTSRYGSREDFQYFVDYMHQNGIGVILDWVPAHFPKDDFLLGRFDGTALYEHADPRQGEHMDWGTYVFNFGRNEVKNFLIGSALFWLEEYHVDGLRVDAVASMLYLDYSRKPGEWIPNQYGGNENLEAIAFIKQLNELVHLRNPGCLTIAEESTIWPGVSKPVYTGGLGFDFKWNMGWMHDTLEYFKTDPLYRTYHHDKITFPFGYAFAENYILPLSHDEVVHGKCSLICKMPGPYEQKFANLRILYTLAMTHPGKKMSFMGNEFAQMVEWKCHSTLDWMLLRYPIHQGMQNLVKALNGLYLENPSLWENDTTYEGFRWIDGGNYKQCVLAFCRLDKTGKKPLVIVLNLTPEVRRDFSVGVPLPGKWREIFNTDALEFGGTGIVNNGVLETHEEFWHGQNQLVNINLPWLGAVILAPADK